MRFLKNKPGTKPLVYFLSETIIVTIGILIAIQLNNMNETRKNRSEGQKSLERIYTDLSMEKSIMERYKNRIDYNNICLKEIIKDGRTARMDSIVYLFSSFSHYKMDAEYINLKYSGKLNLIENDRLRYLLVSYYEMVHNQYAKIEKRSFDFENKKMSPFFETEFPADTTSLIAESLVLEKLKKPKFKGLIRDQINIYNLLSANIHPEYIDTLLTHIRVELKD